MTTRKGTTTDAQRDAFIAAPNPASAARVLGIDGKRVRAYLRGTLGVHVSKDASAYTREVRGALFDHFAPKSDSK